MPLLIMQLLGFNRSSAFYHLATQHISQSLTAYLKVPFFSAFVFFKKKETAFTPQKQHFM